MIGLPKLSVIITAKDLNDPKLKDLQYSLTQQTFQDFETIIVTEGDSESAKAIGIKKAQGEIVCILASDNYLDEINFFERCIETMNNGANATSPMYYGVMDSGVDNMLNRYFSLFGVNDPIPLYLDKNDRFPHWNIAKVNFYGNFRTFGDNGFFIRKDIILQSDMEHYYHIDNIYDVWCKLDLNFKYTPFISIWHRTGGNIFKFFWKRFYYADKFNTPYRRWHMVETRQDYLRLLWFIFCTITLIQPLYLSFKGYRVIKDRAWFLHPIVCWLTLITYGLWVLKRLLSAVPTIAHKSWLGLKHLLIGRLSKTTN